MDLYVVNFIFKNSIIEHILIVFIVLITSTEHVLQFSFFRHKIQKTIQDAYLNLKYNHSKTPFSFSFLF